MTENINPQDDNANNSQINIDGDFVQGDKVGADKIGRDKIDIDGISNSDGIAIGEGALANVDKSTHTHVEEQTNIHIEEQTNIIKITPSTNKQEKPQWRIKVSAIVIMISLFLVLGWFLRVEFYVNGVKKSPPAIDSIATIITGDEGLSARLYADLKIENEPFSTVLSNTVQIRIVPTDTDAVALKIELPRTPAYQLDFWQEVRMFQGEMSYEHAVKFSKAVLAYSVGNYDAVVLNLSGYKLPLEANILNAQALLFVDDSQSHNYYQIALDVIDEDHPDKMSWQMGQALAYWRPMLGIPNDLNIYKEDCPAALKIYDEMISDNPSNGDIVILKEIANLYCNGVDPTTPLLEDTRTKGEELDADSALINFWEANMLAKNYAATDNDRILRLLTQAAPTIHLANAMLGFEYVQNSNLIGEQCGRAGYYLQVYQDMLYTETDQAIAQDLTRRLYTYSLAELCQ